ncbi:hypothetical protein CSKR_111172 [Clonorchis sinensis]|uniref:Uncharacterized protein n=1 Tax=Clonorchis sinensis TaxID=79923 RepID=A0A419QGF8_CLOSI|nr:hypothetical protein CSKR_111172 [Clonorchis sinensis]
MISVVLRNGLKLVNYIIAPLDELSRSSIMETTNKIAENYSTVHDRFSSSCCAVPEFPSNERTFISKYLTRLKNFELLGRELNWIYSKHLTYRLAVIGENITALFTGSATNGHRRKLWRRIRLELKKIMKKKKDTLIVIDFYLTYCPPCRKIAPVYESLAAETKNVIFLKVNGQEGGLKQKPMEFIRFKNNPIILIHEAFGRFSRVELYERIKNIGLNKDFGLSQSVFGKSGRHWRAELKNCFSTYSYIICITDYHHTIKAILNHIRYQSEGVLKRVGGIDTVLMEVSVLQDYVIIAGNFKRKPSYLLGGLAGDTVTEITVHFIGNAKSANRCDL